jgi:hypothetical protein
MTDQEQQTNDRGQQVAGPAPSTAATEPAEVPAEQIQAPRAESGPVQGGLTSLDALFGGPIEGGTSCSTDGVCD